MGRASRKKHLNRIAKQFEVGQRVSFKFGADIIEGTISEMTREKPRNFFEANSAEGLNPDEPRMLIVSDMEIEGIGPIRVWTNPSVINEHLV